MAIGIEAAPAGPTTSLFEALPGLRVHDVDTHLLEPADLWTSRVASRWRDDVPHIVADPQTGWETWHVGSVRLSPAGAFAPAGWAETSPSRPPRIVDADPGAWQPQPRLEWMDRHGIFSQVLYPNLLGFFSKIFLRLDPELHLACVRAYNDFQSEFCAAAPDRLVALSCLPFWDLELSLAELERCHGLGHRGINFGWELEKVGLPPLRDPHWEPLLKTVEEMGWSVSFHIGFNSITEDDAAKVAAMTDSRDMAKFSALTILGNQSCIAELTLGGICDRYPTLRFVSVESGAGYLPFLLDALDWQYSNTAARDHPDSLLPSEYFRRQIYGTFWFEHHVADAIGLYPDNLMFETDYPHPTSLSPGPNTIALSPRETIEQNLADVPLEHVAKVLHDNAARLYGLS